MENFASQEKANLTLLITAHCTLKCKLCATYAPIHPSPCHYSHEDMIKEVKRFFQCFDEVHLFTLSGGEPFLHPKLPEMIDNFKQYIEKIDVFEIITNGTIIPKKEVLEALTFSDKVDILIDDYGPELSNKVPELIQEFEQYHIKYRVRKYYGPDAHCGGWEDFSIKEDKNRTDEENEALYAKCLYKTTFKNHYFVINGLVFMCYVNNKLLPHVHETEDESVNLLDDTLSDDQMREKLLNIRNRKMLSVCRYCNGFCSDAKRYPPAEQMD